MSDAMAKAKEAYKDFMGMHGKQWGDLVEAAFTSAYLAGLKAGLQAGLDKDRKELKDALSRD